MRVALQHVSKGTKTGGLFDEKEPGDVEDVAKALVRARRRRPDVL